MRILFFIFIFLALQTKAQMPDGFLFSINGGGLFAVQHPHTSPYSGFQHGLGIGYGRNSKNRIGFQALLSWETYPHRMKMGDGLYVRVRQRGPSVQLKSLLRITENIFCTAGIRAFFETTSLIDISQQRGNANYGASASSFYLGYYSQRIKPAAHFGISFPLFTGSGGSITTEIFYEQEALAPVTEDFRFENIVLGKNSLAGIAGLSLIISTRK